MVTLIAQVFVEPNQENEQFKQLLVGYRWRMTQLMLIGYRLDY